MMSEASFASLGPTLLARKGGAKPAMRPQLAPLSNNLSELAALADEQLEDLGWNDMGADYGAEDCAIGESQAPVAAPLPLLSSKPSTNRANGEADPIARTDEARQVSDPLTSADVVPLNAHKDRRSATNKDTLQAGSPVVRSQQKRLARRVLNDAAQSLSEAAGSTKSKAPKKPGRRAAFTLRLDPDRHLKLRLAATMQGVSAQSLVTEALDEMLNGIEELDALVERLKRDRT